MPVPTFSGYRRLSKTHKYSAAGVAAAGVAAMVFAVVPAADAEQGTHSSQALSAKRVTKPHTDDLGKVQKEGDAPMPSGDKADDGAKKAKERARQKAAELARQKKAAADMAKKKKEFAAKAKADQERAAKEAANRSQKRKPVTASKKYANNLDGWIREALDIMKQHRIPGTYEGIHRNIMRESSGNPRAINNWDINARNGVPSKGLLQVIKPTFDAYHVPGTAYDQYDPVANIVAACNYAAHRYGSIDNVNSAY
jgi:hypothetical protein